MADDQQVATTLDEQIETKITTDGTVTVKLIGDEQMIRDIDFAQTMVEFAANEYFWRRYADETAKDRSIAAEGKLKQIFFEAWANEEMGAKAYGRFRLLLLYMHRVKAQA
jgi:hypothetical protein